MVHKRAKTALTSSEKPYVVPPPGNCTEPDNGFTVPQPVGPPTKARLGYSARPSRDEVVRQIVERWIG
jgi:hypothetical protein